MLVTVRTLMAIFLFMLAFVHLPGCGSTGGGGGSSSSNDGQDLNIALSTTTGATSIPADGTSSVTLQMTVTRASGAGMANTPVVFSSTAGTLTTATVSVAARQAAQSGSLTVNTDANGVAQAILTSGTNVETATVMAEVEGFRQSIRIDFISGIPDQLALTAQPTTVGSNQTSTVRATVTDANGDPLEQVSVAFTLVTNNSGAALSTATAVTNSDGQASVTYTPGATAGTDTVQAAVSGNITATVNISVQAVTTAAASINLLVSSPQLDSDGSETVTLTALTRDANNNVLADIPVTFAADSGGIQVINSTTDAAGTATALLSTAGDRSNRTITVTATAGELTSTNSVEVSGTTVAISGVNSLVLGGTTTLSILLQDSGGNGIPNRAVAVTSNQGNTLSAATVTTDSNGQATVDVTADNPSNDTITASALGTSGAITLVVNSADFSFITPDPTAPADQREVALGTCQTVTIRWLEAGVPQVGETINFFATRGVFFAVTDVNCEAGNLTAPSTVTDVNGEASVRVSSTTAGPAVITAAAATTNGPSSQVAVEFVATTANSLILQAAPTTLGVNPAGSTKQQSIITAVVRDAANNLVKNQRVSFTLTDSTGGSIFPAAATTDSFGRASTVYTAGATPSAQDGVIINAEVVGAINAEVRLTVAQQALFVKVGTSHLIQALSDTQYAKPYSVLVTDANSNPVAGARVELNIYPPRYQKGFYTRFYDENGTCIGWGKVPTVTGLADDADAACNNEDLNRNGILNPGEDSNDNGILDPGNIATAPTAVTTDATGFALFDVVYAREFTWVEVQIEARATVAGSEASSTATFFLPGLASDFDDCDVSPPGVVSPYGIATTCSCDEATAPTGSCPTRTFLGPVNLNPVSTTLPAEGGVVTFNVAGGTETTYFIEATSGTLSASAVDFGDTFTLTVPPNIVFTEITVTVIDAVTGQIGTAVVIQLP